MAQKRTHSGTKWQDFAKSNAFFCLFLQKNVRFCAKQTQCHAEHSVIACIDHFADVGKMVGHPFPKWKLLNMPPVFRSTARFKYDGQEHAQNIKTHSA